VRRTSTLVSTTGKADIMHPHPTIPKFVLAALPLFMACGEDDGSDPNDTASPGETEGSMSDGATANDAGDSSGAGAPHLEVRLSFDSFSTDTFMCVIHEGTIVFGAPMDTSDEGEAVQVAGSVGGDVPQQITLNLGSEVWAVYEDDDASGQIGMFLELEVDAARGTVEGRAAVEETSTLDSDGTDTLTFVVRC
jgi:hypothetical protein